MTFIRTSASRLPSLSNPQANRRVTRLKRTRDRSAKQVALLQSALKLFATKGYEATTTREIAAGAGCAEGLIHRYFKGKAGLLTTLIDRHFSTEIADLGRELQPGQDLPTEFLQLVLWEMERFWETHDLLKVLITRAFVDSAVAEALKRGGISVRAKAILERLKRYPSCSTLARDELEALAQSVGMLGLVFGFMRPLVLGQDRAQAKRMAMTLARMLVRSVDSHAIDQFS
jgi:AcrR family transcriptional regulator